MDSEATAWWVEMVVPFIRLAYLSILNPFNRDCFNVMGDERNWQV